MAFSTSDIKTPQPTRQDFANAFGNNQRLIRFFEQLTSDVRQTIPDAIVSVSDISSAPFIVQAASSLVPNASVLTAGHGIALAVAPGTLTVSLGVPVSIADGGTSATTAAQALTNLGGVTAAQAAAAAPVQSVFGRIGAVVAQTGDYSAAQVTGAAALAGAAFTGAVSVAGAFTQTGGGAVTFSVRPTWAGATPYDTGNLNPALFAPLLSPTFTGVPTVPTAAAHTSTGQAASTQFVETEFASPPAIGTGAPGSGNFTSVTASSYAGPATGYSIVTTSGLGSGGGIQLFDATHGNNVGITNNGTTVATFTASGIVPVSTIGIKGTTTNDVPLAGNVGEPLTSTGTAISLTSATVTNVASLALTAGDWEVFGSCAFIPSAGSTPSALIAGASGTSATLAAAPLNTVQQLVFPTALAQAFPFPAQRFSLAAPATVFLVAEAVYTGGTLTATGTIRARRPR